MTAVFSGAFRRITFLRGSLALGEGGFGLELLLLFRSIRWNCGWSERCNTRATYFCKSLTRGCVQIHCADRAAFAPPWVPILKRGKSKPEGHGSVSVSLRGCVLVWRLSLRRIFPAWFFLFSGPWSLNPVLCALLEASHHVDECNEVLVLKAHACGAGHVVEVLTRCACTVATYPHLSSCLGGWLWFRCAAGAVGQDHVNASAIAVNVTANVRVNVTADGDVNADANLECSTPTDGMPETADEG